MKRYTLFGVLLLSLVIILSSCGSKKDANINKYFFKSQLKPKIVPVSKRKSRITTKKTTNKTIKTKKTETKKAKLLKVPQFIETENISISTFLPKTKTDEKIKFPKEEIQISVEDMPIYDFINLVFGQLLNLNYIISPEVQNLRKNITLNMTSKMEPKKFLQFIIDFLKDYQIQVLYKDNVFYIKRKKRVRAKITYSDNIIIGRNIPSDISPDLNITMVIPLFYISNNQFSRLIRQFVNSNEVLIDFIGRSTVIVSGKVKNLLKIEKLIKVFDRPYFSKKHIYIADVEYLTSEEIAKELEKVLKPIGIPISDKSKENSLTIIPLKRNNSLLLISPKKEWIDTAIYWKNQIDTIDAFAEEPQLFIYKPKNRSADELAKVLQKVLQSAHINIPAQKTKTKKQTSKIGNKNLNISVDEERNSIVVMAYPSEYKKIKRILEKLDTQPKQVLVEVTIAEITLTDQLQFGFEWFLKHSDSSFIGELKTLGGLGIGGAGFNYSLIETSGKLSMLFNAFAKKNLINIVSTPHIVVLDGKEATIRVGTEVPVVLSETTATDITNTTGQPSILRNVQYRNTGVLLSVKPTITSDDNLNIEISQELSEAQTNSVSNIDSPLILNRSINTILNIKSGQTVLLGGLISKNTSKSRSKIPFLGNLPLIGNLFSVDSKGKSKTELIILITPYIINNNNELDNIVKKIYNKE